MHKKVNSCYKILLRKVIRRGFNEKDPKNDDFGFKIYDEGSQKICHSTDMSTYIAHVIKRDDGMAIKRLIFESTQSQKRVRLCSTLIFSVTKHQKLNVNQFRKLALDQ